MPKDEDDLCTSLAHIVLCCVAGNGLSRASSKTFTHPGMHANFVLHGIVGFLHYQSGTFNNDFTAIYNVSLSASKYLALPCLMADLYSSDQAVCTIHLLSGVIPFALSLSGNANNELGHLLIACNVISLTYYSHKNNNEWGWYTAGAALLSYFVTLQVKKSIVYPLALAFMDHCAYKMWHRSFDVVEPRPGRRN